MDDQARARFYELMAQQRDLMREMRENPGDLDADVARWRVAREGFRDVMAVFDEWDVRDPYEP